MLAGQDAPNTWTLRGGKSRPRVPVPPGGPAAANDLPTDGAVAPVFPECGQALADCRLLAELGHGIHSRVFLATQPLLADRPVVLKVCSLDGQEHLTLARLFHTYLIPLHFVQDLPERGLRVLCQPYLGGAPLAGLMQELAPVPPARRSTADLLDALDRIQSRAPLTVSTAGPTRVLLAKLSYVEAVCWLGACLADALEHAHERGLVHLDIKPSNVLLAADGQPFLLDFHLARPPLAAGEQLADWFGGTLAYMSPEQQKAATALAERQPSPVAVDGRSDLYSLARVLDELLGGPNRADGPPSRPLRQRNPNVSAGLADVLARCLDNEPGRRYPRAADFAADLRRHLAHEPLEGVSNRSRLERWYKWRRRRPQALIRAGTFCVVAIALLSLAGINIANFYQRQRLAETSLADGRKLYRDGKFLEAEQAFAQGCRQAAALPFRAELAQALTEERQRARTATLAGELKGLADQLRFLCEPQTLPPEQARELASQCSRLWQLGPNLLEQAQRVSSQEITEQVRTDLLDVALLWTNLELRYASPSEAEAVHRRALAILDEAERLCGFSPVLAQERRQHQQVLQLSTGDDLGKEKLPLADLHTSWERYALGRALLFRGDNQRALAPLEQALREQPQGFWPNFYHGVCLYRLGRPAEAAASFRVCIALAPEAAACYYNHGLAMQALNQTNRALQDYEQALRRNATIASAWLNLGVLHYQRHELDQAQTELQQALHYGADAGLVYYDLALVHQERKDRPSAIACLEISLRHRPDNVGARDLLAQLRKTK